MKFVALLKPGSRVLDLGCGSGRDSVAFRKLGFEVLAIDGADEFVRHVSSLQIPAQKMLMEELFFENEFDAIWCCASLVHVNKNNLPDVIRRIKKALKSRGLCFFSFKMGEGEGFENGRYFHYVNEEQLRTYLINYEILSISKNSSDSNQTPTTWISAIAQKTT